MYKHHKSKNTIIVFQISMTLENNTDEVLEGWKRQVTYEFQIATTNPYYKPENIIINGNSNAKPEEPEKPNPPEEKKAEVIIQEENQWGTEGDYYTQIL